MTIKDLKIGERAVIDVVGGEGALRQHFLDMGVIPGAEVTVVKFAPMGDPVELRIHGYELTLRLDDAARITVSRIDGESPDAPEDSGIQSLLESPEIIGDSEMIENSETFEDSETLDASEILEAPETLIVPETLETSETPEASETSETSSAHLIQGDEKGNKAGKDSKDSKDNQRSRDTKASRDSKSSKDSKANGDSKTSKDSKSSRDNKTSKDNKACKDGREKKRPVAHPYFGEPGVHHEKRTENPLPEDHILTFALVGNQNCGKTTLFNRLTGANQHVGNFPGVTVDRKDGAILGYPKTLITDLPGIYSMSPYSSEEVVSRNFVLKDEPDAIINIVDATNIERNLYLTMQLLEMNRPMVVALNMMDELTGNGGSIDVNAMEAQLGVPVVPISAAKNQGIEELVTHAVHVAKYQEKPLRLDFCPKDDFGGAVHRCLHAVVHLIEDHAEKARIPVRFAASKAIEGDQLIIDQLVLDQNEKELLEHITVQMETERGLDRSAAIADMRFRFIEKVCAECVRKPRESKEHLRSERLDRLLTGRYTAIPIFIVIMGTVFYLTFNVIGAWLQGLLETAIDWLTDVTAKAMAAAGVNPVLQDLVLSGIFEGVGSVLSFLPIVVTMFFFLSLLEDSGYIARVAFFMDKLLRRIGLSGRSIVPMLIGFGCTVPAVMATRTLPSERDRRMTILLTPFMSCTAKLPIYSFFVNAFFPGKGGFIITGLYLFGIIVGILDAFLYKKFLFKGEAVPFVMELPNYRLPSARSTIQLMWEKAKDFLQKAFSVILVATVVVWFLQSFSLRFNLVEDSADSIMALLAGALVPLFKPLGLGDWRICTSLISGFMAKESVVSVLEVLFSAQGGVTAVLGTAEAGALLVFSLLYTPCVAAIASIKRELGAKWAAGVVVWQCVVAWVCALAVKLVIGVFL